MLKILGIPITKLTIDNGNQKKRYLIGKIATKINLPLTLMRPR